MLQPGDRVLLGVSGGPDSMALLHLLYGWRERGQLALGVVHFDHGLRGRESQQEAVFVAEQAASLGLPVYQERGEVRHYAQSHKLSLQVAARQLRLAGFERLRQEKNYPKLALGHTADDQVELFFLRLLRGAGPEGLKGMWPCSPSGLIRPLLGVTKAEILAWLAQEGLPYCQDSSNFSYKYRRNQIRLELLPKLRRQYNPRLNEAIWRTQALLQEQEDYLAQATARQLAELTQVTAPDRLHLDLKRLRALHPYLQKRVLRLALGRISAELTGLSYLHLKNALELCQQYQSAGEITLPGGWRLVRARDRLELTRDQPPSLPRGTLVLPATDQGSFPGFGWLLKWTTYAATAPVDCYTPPETARMDRNKVQFPLILRSLQPGDRFQPLGMSGTKKLQDFLVDAKIPRSQRLSFPLLLSQDQIIWVVGQRLADPVKITPQTTTILEITASRE
ncbi:MAG: tRNA lysidine(34) synthetase TilS [Desulfobacca sp.]|nr:tRNA lysidine(34) synthetase TilS [Desulfobacca sp.]